ncbi:purine permease 3 [Canna indica]|uniref:Probable purine permease n=1 Tax=Canna indica TaxID=4628 RepID=A0AAQ3QGU9_9LILI|nr:purine permease 3 [Canna indica]
MAMEVESHRSPPNRGNQMNKYLMTSFKFLNYSALLITSAIFPLLFRLYFINGGQRKWFTSWLQTSAWPLTLIPLAVSYLYRRRLCAATNQPPPKLWISKPPVAVAGSLLGLLIGLGDFLYAYAADYLPVSTSSIIVSTQLAFTALFAFLIVRQKFTAFSVNAVVLLMTSSVLLGLNANGDRPEGVSKGKYLLGFFLLLLASALYGLFLPLLELTYNKAKHAVCYTMAMEVQLLIGFFATAFCTVGMIANNDFHVIEREAQVFGLGELKYYMIVTWSSIICEILFIAIVGTVFYGSALLSGIIYSVSIPITEVSAVIFLDESFSSAKGVALVLSFWGFAYYFYGEYKMSKKKSPMVVEPVLEDS